jgi:hypothetical protein
MSRADQPPYGADRHNIRLAASMPLVSRQKAHDNQLPVEKKA